MASLLSIFPGIEKKRQPGLKNMHKLCVFSVFLLFPSLLFAQRSMEIGAMGGVTYYIGELNPGMPFSNVRPAYGLLYRFNFNNRVAVRYHGLIGEVRADDALTGANPDRMLNFQSKIQEGGVQLEINFFEFFIGSKYHAITPYLFGGINIFHFEPYGMVDGTKLALKPLHTEGQGVAANAPAAYDLISYAIPFGLGMKLSLGKRIGLGAEWGMRKTGTDYLDDVSTAYYLDQAGTSALTAPAEGLASDPTLAHDSGMQRGNSQNKDWYSFAGLSLTIKFKLAGKEKCLDHQREGY